MKGITVSEIGIGDWTQYLAIPQSSQAFQSNRALSKKTSKHNSRYYIRQYEGYDHQNDGNANAILLPSTVGKLIDFAKGSILDFI